MVSPTRTLPDVAALDVADAKQALRAHFRHARRGRSPRDCAALAEDLAETALEVVGSASCVAAYVSRPLEPGTAPLLSALHRQGVAVLLPTLGPGLSRGWAEYQGAADLSVRAPGRPPEPSGAASGAEALGSADVVVTPALAVDSAGYRLGQGGGWYDRALRHVRPGALVICAVYDEEFVDGMLPRDEHDVPVHAVLTPSRWWRVG
jgi:5-formyltetrahydrofolate cyclo-ligase